MLLIHLHTDRQTGHVTTIPNTPAPRPNPSRAPSCPRLTPADPWRPSVTGLWDVLIGSRGWSGRWGGALRGRDPVLARGLVLSGSGGRAFRGGTRGTNMKGFVGGGRGVKRIVRKMLFLTPVQVCCHKNAERSIRLQQLGLNAGSRCRGHIHLCLPPVFNRGNQRRSRTHCCVQCCVEIPAHDH